MKGWAMGWAMGSGRRWGLGQGRTQSGLALALRRTPPAQSPANVIDFLR